VLQIRHVQEDVHSGCMLKKFLNVLNLIFHDQNNEIDFMLTFCLFNFISWRYWRLLVVLTEVTLRRENRAQNSIEQENNNVTCTNSAE